MAKRRKIDNTDFEIQFYEGLIKKRPNFIQALSALGDLYTKTGQFVKGLQIDQRLVLIKPDEPIVLYNLACSYSLLGDMNQSFKCIKDAIENGYDDFEHLLEDEDLVNLRRDTRFKKYFSRVKSKIHGKA